MEPTAFATFLRPKAFPKPRYSIGGVLRVRHYHTSTPFICMKGTMMGWAVSPQCDPEIVELCSELVVGDVIFLPNQEALFKELSRRGVNDEALRELRQESFREQPPQSQPSLKSRD